MTRVVRAMASWPARPYIAPMSTTTQGGRTRRSTMPAALPRAGKRRRGRTKSVDTPAHVRTFGVDLDDEDRAYIRRRLGMKLGKFAAAIERVSVRVLDVNGPRGGVDKQCRVKVVLDGLESVVVEATDPTKRTAIDGALDRTDTAVERRLGRRRTLPVRTASGMPRRGARRVRLR